MTKDIRNQINTLLENPDLLLLKEPFYRGVKIKAQRRIYDKVPITGKIFASVPMVDLIPVTVEDYAQELDVYSHKVLFDENIPAITAKMNKDGFLELEQYRMAVPFQKLILDKQVRHLCTNAMIQNLINVQPTEKQNRDFVKVKQMWAQKNMEGAKTLFVEAQKSFGDAGLLFYYDSNNKVRTRVVSFEQGYTIITHKNNNGEHLLECLLYQIGDTLYLDCYDDEYMTRFTNESVADVTGKVTSSWKRYPAQPHGFSENPLITKRGKVAWDAGQPLIESYEALYNVFVVIQKKHGYGMLYVKGTFLEEARKIAGNFILNDTSGDPTADAKMLDSPNPNNMIDTLDAMEQAIQKACGTTFILPKDIKISGDTSGLAIELTQELDLATAQDGVSEWQNVANKMMRLFVEGCAKELMNSGDKEYSNALTEFATLDIHNQFSVWKPQSKEAYNNMLVALKSNNMISQRTAVEKNTESTPDELARIEEEEKEEEEKEAQQALQQQTVATENKDTEETIITGND